MPRSNARSRQRLRRVLVLNGTESGAGAEADAGDHFSSFPETAFRQRRDLRWQLRQAPFRGAQVPSAAVVVFKNITT